MITFSRIGPTPIHVVELPGARAGGLIMQDVTPNDEPCPGLETPVNGRIEACGIASAHFPHRIGEPHTDRTDPALSAALARLLTALERRAGVIDPLVLGVDQDGAVTASDFFCGGGGSTDPRPLSQSTNERIMKGLDRFNQQLSQDD